jgi:hypothetical protein
MLIVTTVSARQDSLIVQYDTSGVQLLNYDDSELNKYRNDKQFDYTEFVAKPGILAKIKKWINDQLISFFESLFGKAKGIKYMELFFKYFSYAVLAVLIIFLLKFFLKLNYKDLIKVPPTETKILFDQDEDILRKSDIDSLIENTINEGNFRLALRYYYLKMLKILEQKNHIKYVPEKTNFDYENEIKNSPFESMFRKFNFWYNYVWYGSYPIDAQKFGIISAEFNFFFNEIDSKNG